MSYSQHFTHYTPNSIKQHTTHAHIKHTTAFTNTLHTILTSFSVLLEHRGDYSYAAGVHVQYVRLGVEADRREYAR